MNEKDHQQAERIAEMETRGRENDDGFGTNVNAQ